MSHAGRFRYLPAPADRSLPRLRPWRLRSARRHFHRPPHPATIFGPQGDFVQGPEAVDAANRGAAGHFGPGSTNRFETMHSAADGNLACWVGVQRSVVNVKGKDDPVPMNLRVTEIYRREEGSLKLVHRHADRLAE